MAAGGLAPGCALPPDELGDLSAPAETLRRPGEWVVTERVGAVQLYATGDEASLPVLGPGSGSLTLEFDVRGQELGRALDVSFVHTDRQGREGLLPTEYLTGFETDQILDFERSGASVARPYVHYSYTFPNASVGFAVSGNYRVRVSDPDGGVLLEAPFYVSEEQAEVDLGFGATVQDGSVGFAVQPAARVRPGARVAEFDGSRYTVCFARNGRTDRLRCAPEPSLIDLALYQFYLPRADAFAPQDALFEVDLGFLGLNAEVVDVDPAARPPTATLDLDYADFGGDVRDAVLASVPLVESVYRDVGRADVDADYVDVTFRYVPPGGRQSSRRVFVVGSFNGWTARPGDELAWDQAEGRYTGTVPVKQGRYVYGYTGASSQTPGVGAPSVFTAYVYLSDPRTFTDRLVAVRSGVAR